MALVQFYVKLKNAGVLPADLDAGLVQSLQKLGTFLAVPSHFEADYNHGFNEGAALLLIADNFPYFASSPSWRTLALQRLQQMLTNTIDADGVEVENSPFYHVYVLGLVYQIAQWAKSYEPALAPSYSAAAQKMLAYAAEITQPNGYLPMLGATATTYMPSQDPTVYGPMAAADPGFDFAFTRGAHGTPPPDGTVLFPVSGLFVMRSPLGSVSNLAEPDLRHLQRRHLPDEPLRPRRARDHDVLERLDAPPHLGPLHLHPAARPRVLPRHALAQHGRRRRPGPAAGLRSGGQLRLDRRLDLGDRHERPLRGRPPPAHRRRSSARA